MSLCPKQVFVDDGFPFGQCVRDEGHSGLCDVYRRDETDEELYVRINIAYGRWGAFLSHAMEAKGKALDECAEHVGLKREMISVDPG